jgi:hypothetical protein
VIIGGQKRMRQGLRGRESFRRLFTQQTGNQVLGLGRNFVPVGRRKRKGGVFDQLVQFRVGFSVKRWEPAQQDVPAGEKKKKQKNRGVREKKPKYHIKKKLQSFPSEASQSSQRALSDLS